MSNEGDKKQRDRAVEKQPGRGGERESFLSEAENGRQQRDQEKGQYTGHLSLPIRYLARPMPLWRRNVLSITCGGPVTSKEMIYTCYEMTQDCRADKAEGWRFFISNYIPVIRKLLAHYGGTGETNDAVLERVLVNARKTESSLFQSLEPVPERWFLGELRQNIVSELGRPPAEVELDLETVAAALEPLTVTEKQAAWLETMGYDANASGAMLRMAPKTVDKIRERAGELLRAKVDSWRRTLLAENGPSLGREAVAAKGKDCLPPKVFLDVLDGRTTWRGRETMEQHVRECWHCIDHFCRMAEVIEVIRGVQPLSEAEAAPYRKLLGVAEEKKRFWKR